MMNRLAIASFLCLGLFTQNSLAMIESKNIPHLPPQSESTAQHWHCGLRQGWSLESYYQGKLAKLESTPELFYHNSPKRDLLQDFKGTFDKYEGVLSMFGLNRQTLDTMIKANLPNGNTTVGPAPAKLAQYLETTFGRKYSVANYGTSNSNDVGAALDSLRGLLQNGHPVMIMIQHSVTNFRAGQGLFSVSINIPMLHWLLVYRMESSPSGNQYYIRETNNQDLVYTEAQLIKEWLQFKIDKKLEEPLAKEGVVPGVAIVAEEALSGGSFSGPSSGASIAPVSPTAIAPTATALGTTASSLGATTRNASAGSSRYNYGDTSDVAPSEWGNDFGTDFSNDGEQSENGFDNPFVPPTGQASFGYSAAAPSSPFDGRAIYARTTTTAGITPLKLNFSSNNELPLDPPAVETKSTNLDYEFAELGQRGVERKRDTNFFGINDDVIQSLNIPAQRPGADWQSGLVSGAALVNFYQKSSDDRLAAIDADRKANQEYFLKAPIVSLVDLVLKESKKPVDIATEQLLEAAIKMSPDLQNEVFDFGPIRAHRLAGWAMSSLSSLLPSPFSASVSAKVLKGRFGISEEKLSLGGRKPFPEGDLRNILLSVSQETIVGIGSDNLAKYLSEESRARGVDSKELRAEDADGEQEFRAIPLSVPDLIRLLEAGHPAMLMAHDPNKLSFDASAGSRQVRVPFLPREILEQESIRELLDKGDKVTLPNFRWLLVYGAKIEPNDGQRYFKTRDPEGNNLIWVSEKALVSSLEAMWTGISGIKNSLSAKIQNEGISSRMAVIHKSAYDFLKSLPAGDHHGHIHTTRTNSAPTARTQSMIDVIGSAASDDFAEQLLTSMSSRSSAGFDRAAGVKAVRDAMNTAGIKSMGPSVNQLKAQLETKLGSKFAIIRGARDAQIRDALADAKRTHPVVVMVRSPEITLDSKALGLSNQLPIRFSPVKYLLLTAECSSGIDNPHYHFVEGNKNLTVDPIELEQLRGGPKGAPFTDSQLLRDMAKSSFPAGAVLVEKSLIPHFRPRVRVVPGASNGTNRPGEAPVEIVEEIEEIIDATDDVAAEPAPAPRTLTDGDEEVELIDAADEGDETIVEDVGGASAGSGGRGAGPNGGGSTKKIRKVFRRVAPVSQVSQRIVHQVQTNRASAQSRRSYHAGVSEPTAIVSSGAPTVVEEDAITFFED